jgi:hypothetical protein
MVMAVVRIGRRERPQWLAQQKTRRGEIRPGAAREFQFQQLR